MTEAFLASLMGAVRARKPCGVCGRLGVPGGRRTLRVGERRVPACHPCYAHRIATWGARKRGGGGMKATRARTAANMFVGVTPGGRARVRQQYQRGGA